MTKNLQQAELTPTTILRVGDEVKGSIPNVITVNGIVKNIVERPNAYKHLQFQAVVLPYGSSEICEIPFQNIIKK